MTDVALAFAGVEVKEVVIRARALDALTLAGKGIKLFKFVVTVAQLISARAIDVSILDRPPDELAFWADDQVVCDGVSAWQKLAINHGNEVLCCCLSKISAYLLFHGVECMAGCGEECKGQASGLESLFHV